VATKIARRAAGRMNEAKSKPKEKARQKAKPGSYLGESIRKNPDLYRCLINAYAIFCLLKKRKKKQ
jgi:hypothetical protein